MTWRRSASDDVPHSTTKSPLWEAPRSMRPSNCAGSDPSALTELLKLMTVSRHGTSIPSVPICTTAISFGLAAALNAANAATLSSFW